MKSKILFLLLILPCFFDLQGQDLDWVKPVLSDSGVTSVYKMELTPENEVMVLGRGHGRLHILPDNGFQGNMGYNSFLAKFNDSGEITWSFIPNCDSGANVFNFKIGKDGDIYFTGSFRGTWFIGNDTLISQGGNTGFVARMTESKELVWIRKSFNQTYREIELGMGILLWSWSNSGFTNVEIESHDGFRSYTLEYDFNFGFVNYSFDGELNWAKFYGGNGFNIFFSSPKWQITDNAIYVLSCYWNYTDVNPGPDKTILGSGEEFSLIDRYYIAKYSLQGELMWVYKLTDPENFDYFALDFSFTVDDNENIYLAGNSSGSINLDFKGGKQIVHFGSGKSYFLAKYSANLDFGWMKTFSNDMKQRSGAYGNMDIKYYDGSIYFYGLYYRNLDLDPGPNVYMPDNPKSNFFAEYNLDGELKTGRVFGLPVDSYYYRIPALMVDKYKNVYLSGEVYRHGQFDFDPSNSQYFLNFPSGKGGGFLVRYTTCKKPMEIIPQIKTEKCNERVQTLFGLNDHYPVKWYNSNGFEINEGPTFTLPLLEHSETFVAVDGCGYTDTIHIERQLRFAALNKMFPNPASGEVHISLEGIGEDVLNFSLSNSIGKVVSTGIMYLTEGFQVKSIPLEGLNAGIYVLNLRGNCFLRTEKLIVE